MSNELTLPTLPVSVHATDENFELLVRQSYLPRLQVCGGNSALCQEGKVGVGKLALVRGKDDFVDMGDNVNYIPLSYRFCALRMGLEKVESYYDPNSPEFKQVQIDSEEANSRCTYGPQFLIWIPGQGIKGFATFHFGAKSTRPEGRKMKALLDQKSCGSMKTRLIVTHEYKWHVPVVLPWTGATAADLPKEEIILSTVNQFVNQKSSVSDVEEAIPAGATDGRVR